MARRKRLTPSNPFPDAPEEAFDTKAMPFDSSVRQGEVSTAPMAPVARVAGDQAQAAALREISEEMTRAREGGRMVLELPLDAIDAEHLIRDRLSTDETEMHSLKESLAASGQRNPVEVLDLGGGRYGLISGWRRLAALRALSREGRAVDTVLALLRRPEDQAAAYRAMVEENEIRADLSYYERARIVAKAVEAGVFENDRAALQGLFGAASRARRSKIKSFLLIVRTLDGALSYPAALPERLGLKLSQALRDDDDLSVKLREALGQGADTPEAERAMLRAATTPDASRPKLAVSPASSSHGRDRQGAARVVLSRDRQGRLVLDGPGVTAEFVKRLKSWIDSAR